MTKTKRNFTEGPLFTPLLLFSLPVILSAVIQQLYSAADNVIVGKFSGDPLALAAVGTTTSISGLLLNFIIGISVGCGVVISHAIGAKDNKTVHRAVHTAITVSLILGFVIGVVCAIFSRELLILSGTPEELLDRATLYLRIIFIGFPGTSLYNFSASILRSCGDSKTPLVILTASGIVNVLLNLLFVIGFDMTVDGVALATIISKYLAALFTAGVLIKRKAQPYALAIKELTIELPMLARIIKMGLPAGIQNCMFSFSNLMITAAINTLSTAVISAKAIMMNLISIANAVTSSYNTVTLTAAGQNFGAKNYKRIDRVLVISIGQICVISFAVCMLMYAFTEPISLLYIADDDPERDAVLEAIISMVRVILPFYFLGGVMHSLSGTLRGMGFSFYNMIISIIGVCGFRSLWVLTAFKTPLFNNAPGVYIAWPISWVIVIISLTAIYLFMSKKLKKAS